MGRRRDAPRRRGVRLRTRRGALNGTGRSPGLLFPDELLGISGLQKRESGGIGRRTGLRIRRFIHGGSNPPSRTTCLFAPGTWTANPMGLPERVPTAGLGFSPSTAQTAWRSLVGFSVRMVWLAVFLVMVAALAMTADGVPKALFLPRTALLDKRFPLR